MEHAVLISFLTAACHVDIKTEARTVILGHKMKNAW